MKISNKLNLFIIIGLFILMVLSIVLPRISSTYIDARKINEYSINEISEEHYGDYNPISLNDLIVESDLILKVKQYNLSNKYKDVVYAECKVISVLKGEYSEEYITIREHYNIAGYNTKAYFTNNYNECLPMIWDSEYYMFLKLNDNEEFEYTIREYGRFNIHGDVPTSDVNEYNVNNENKFYDIYSIDESRNMDHYDKYFVMKYNNYLMLRKSLLISITEWEGNL